MVFGAFCLNTQSQIPVDTSFTSYSVILKTPTGDIHGTLTMPEGNKKTPVVLLIPGAGNTDRDCNSLSVGVKTNAYKLLAENLAHHGISVLRFDKRGVAKSTPALKQSNDLKFDDYVNDAIGWIHYLKQGASFSKVVILGHSEGSLVGIIAAEKVPVASFISVEGDGKPADQIMRDRVKSISPDLIEESNAILDSMKAGYQVRYVNPKLNGFFYSGVQPFLISWMRYNPVKEISQLKIPVMIIHGKEDIQVPVENAKSLAAAKPDAKLLIIDNMNFVLKDLRGDSRNNQLSFMKPDLPLSEELIRGIVDFIIP
jgi:pimeloyl-ACP methyl ester carboxylesterase